MSEILTSTKTLLGSIRVIVDVRVVVQPAHRHVVTASAVAPLNPVFHSLLSYSRSSYDTREVALATASARSHVM